ncbi:MAG TPA: FAD-dependent oxidoreductase [Lactobacillaceae bacterium]|jgi:glycerol-3-phosphate dehydrogenase
MTFSVKERANYVKRLSTEQFDVTIIGGGITGAGIALQAAASGLKTALIDMQDFAEGTSSRSTKLVHGGIRYLKTFDVDVVADTVSERARLQRIAPHIPRPSKMLMPLYDEPGQTFTPFSAKIAMELYDKLAAVPTDSEWSNQLLSPEQAREYLPELDDTGLKGLAIYLDYQNNDARLTIENIKQAVEDGAVAVSHIKATRFVNNQDGRVNGVLVTDVLNGGDFVIQSHIVINAGGPFNDLVRGLDGQQHEQHIRPTKGVHLVIDQSKLQVPHTVYFDSGFNDGRMLFVIPRENKTYFGTTDTDYKGDYEHPTVEQVDVDYLLTAVNKRFPGTDLTIDDIEASWAGLRPLIGGGDYNGNASQAKVTDDDLRTLDTTLQRYFHEQIDREAVEKTIAELGTSKAAASTVSRGADVQVGDNGVVHVLGGKLTDYRLMAVSALQKVVELLSEISEEKFTLIDSTQYQISGGHFNPDDVNGAINAYAKELQSAGLDEDESLDIANFYGSNSSKIATYVKKGYAAEGLTLGQTATLHYALDEEAVVRPIDYLLRRTNYLLFRSDILDQIEDAVIDEMARVLHWTYAEKLAMRAEYFTFRNEAQLKSLKGAVQ